MLCYSLQPLPQHIQTAPGSLDRAEVEESSKLHVLLAVSTLTISGIAHAGD